MKKLLTLALGILPLVSCGTPPEPISSSESAHHPASSVPASENDVLNFHTVNAKLLRSGDVLDGDMPELVAAGVKTILSLEDEGGHATLAAEERHAAKDAGLGYVWQPWSNSEAPTLAEINAALAVITDPALQPVLVHCKHGSDRTGIAVAAYRIRFDHWTKNAAIAEMRLYGHYSGLFFWDSVLGQVH